MDVFKEEIKRLINEGIIRTSKSVFSSPSFLLKKKSGKPRLIIDFRELNKFTLEDNFPFPALEDLFVGLKEARYFSQLDLGNGYYQIPIAKEDQWKTSFTTPFGQYEFIRMPFGLSTAPRIFQREMTKIFEDIPEVRVFVDDILISTKTLEQHQEVLEKVWKKVQKHGISLNLEKCKFSVNEITYLGQILHEGKMKFDLSSLKEALFKKIPKTKRDVRKLIGYTNWFRQYIPKLSEISRPLCNLLKEKEVFNWAKEHEDARKKIYEEIMKQNQLIIPQLNEPFELHTDASDHGISDVLTQKGKVIKLFSKALTKTQSQYSTVEKELFAIPECMKAFRKLVSMVHTSIYTDNRNIVYDKSALSNRSQRWKIALSEFPHTLIYRAGSLNAGPDYLSRLYAIKTTDFLSTTELLKWQGKYNIPSKKLNQKLRLIMKISCFWMQKKE